MAFAEAYSRLGLELSMLSDKGFGLYHATGCSMAGR